MVANRRWALAVLLLQLAGCTPAQVVPPPAPVDIDVGALGRLEPEWKVYQVAAPASLEGNRLERLLVQEGALVERGQPLATLDTLARREADLLEAQAQLGVTEARLDLVLAGAKADEIAAQEAAVEQLRASLVNAEASSRRASRLRTSAAIAGEEYDLLRTKAEVSRHSLRQAEAMLAALRTVRPEDVALARAEREKARAGVCRAEIAVEQCQVRSPIAGKVLKVHTRPGERVGDKGVAEVGNTAAMEAVAEVHETDLPRIQVGQRATVRLRTRAGGELTGAVVHVGLLVGRRVVLDNDPVKDSDARVVEVRVRLDAGSAVAGLSYAQCEVVIHTAGGG